VAGTLTFFDLAGWYDDFVTELRTLAAAKDSRLVVADGDMADSTSQRMLFLGGAELDADPDLDDLEGVSSTQGWTVGWSLLVHWDTRDLSSARFYAQEIVGTIYEAAAATTRTGQVLEAVPSIDRYAPALPENQRGVAVTMFGTISLKVATG